MNLRERILNRVAPVYGPVMGHGFKWLSSGKYRRQHSELERLRRFPDDQDGFSMLVAPGVDFVDAASLVWMWREIFEREVYKFSTDSSAPRVIDGGANIGLASLYWKHLYPSARIVAFEPDAHIAGVLRVNLKRARHEDVEVVERALWSHETELSFASDGADGGHIELTSETAAPVKTVSLSRYLEEGVDLLKLDIEGAETRVLNECDSKLGNVQRIFIEWHSFPNEEQSLSDILVQLKDAGFRLHIESEFHAAQPLFSRPLHSGMDNRVNIFAWRPS